LLNERPFGFNSAQATTYIPGSLHHTDADSLSLAIAYMATDTPAPGADYSMEQCEAKEEEQTAM
jgi:hypothetical protein